MTMKVKAPAIMTGNQASRQQANLEASNLRSHIKTLVEEQAALALSIKRLASKKTHASLASLARALHNLEQVTAWINQGYTYRPGMIQRQRKRD